MEKGKSTYRVSHPQSVEASASMGSTGGPFTSRWAGQVARDLPSDALLHPKPDVPLPLRSKAPGLKTVSLPPWLQPRYILAPIVPELESK
jgi:hypothetical protein